MEPGKQKKGQTSAEMYEEEVNEMFTTLPDDNEEKTEEKEKPKDEEDNASTGEDR